jgi:hypothetical protein
MRKASWSEVGKKQHTVAGGWYIVMVVMQYIRLNATTYFVCPHELCRRCFCLQHCTEGSDNSAAHWLSVELRIIVKIAFFNVNRVTTIGTSKIAAIQIYDELYCRSLNKTFTWRDQDDTEAFRNMSETTRWSFKTEILAQDVDENRTAIGRQEKFTRFATRVSH